MKVDDVLTQSFNFYKKQFVAFTIATVIAVLGSFLIITIAPLTFGLYIMALKAISGEEVKSTDVFKGFNYFITSWVLMIVEIVAISIGFMALVIPGLLLMLLFMYAIPIAIKEGEGGIASLKRSFDIGKKNLQFTLIVGVIYFAISMVGSMTYVLMVATVPFSAIFLTLAYLNLKLAEVEEEVEATST